MAAHPDLPRVALDEPVPAGPNTVRELRDALCARVLDRSLPASELPATYSAAVDAWLEERFLLATRHRTRGYALVAVGGYGRGELAPGSDLDLVLFHRARPNAHRVAEALWYGIWDSGLHLDHSVRTRGEALTVARNDLRAILGLLDARVVAGDHGVVDRLLGQMPELWRRQFPAMRAELEDAVGRRHRGSGELAFLLEPDLKLSSGGLRDVAVVRSLVIACPELVGLLDLAGLAAAERLVLSARVVLHCRTGAGGDRLLLQEQDQVAEILGFEDADRLMAAMAEAGRTVASTLDLAWRRIRAASDPAATERPIAPGIVLRGAEVGLAVDADPAAQPGLLVELARSAAERNAIIERESLDRLEAAGVVPPDPWPAEMREAFVGLLATGDALVAAVEALDQRHLFEVLLPEWTVVRNRPQRNAYHRFTVDRHLLEAVARANEHVGEVTRPDLLLLGALLHDIGKGHPGDHSEVGTELTATIARRMGYPEEDVATLVHLVSFHLVLPEVATRRDVADPATATLVAKLVGDRETLDLLAALTVADARATGPAAWGPWKAELVATLVDRVGRVLDGEPLPEPRPSPLSDELAELVAASRVAVHVLGRRVSVVAPDRPGLLAAVTGVLALHGCNVRRASAISAEGHMAVELFDVEPAFDRLPDWERVEADVGAALEGDLDLEARLAEHDRAYARGRRPASAYPTESHVLVDDESSELGSIIEVRTLDRLGLLHAITDALARLGLDVVSALVDTLGHEVIDTFYVRDRSGRRLDAPAARDAVHRALDRVIDGAA